MDYIRKCGLHPPQGEPLDSALSDSLSPDLGEVWQYVCPQIPMWDSECDRSASAHANTLDDGSVTSSTLSSEESFEYHEHNMWNPMFASLCYFDKSGLTAKLHISDSRGSTRAR